MRVKESSLAGSWYPADRAALRNLVQELLGQAHAADLVDLTGLVVPHAGYRYSGRAAAHAYRQLEGGHYNRVVVLAPSHFVNFSGVALPPIDAFRTPLGEVLVDTSTVMALTGRDGFSLDLAPFRQEHSLEIQLPFLQIVSPDALVVPLVAGRMTREEILRTSQMLMPLVDLSTIFVASSDFVHYGERFGFVPFSPRGPEELRGALAELDGGAISEVLSRNLDGFLDYLGATGATVCGRVPIGILMALLGPGPLAHKLCYYTSLDVVGDCTSTVSYAAIAFTRAPVD